MSARENHPTAAPTGCRLFSRGVIFTRARVSLALLPLRKNGGLLESNGTREIESPALQWYTIQINTYFSKFWFSKLWLFKQKLSPHNIIQMPFWWICILWFILRCRDEKWWPASVFSAKEQSLGCSHQPSRSWKTPERTTRTRIGETGVWKKGMKGSKCEEFEQHHQFKLTWNP